MTVTSIKHFFYSGLVNLGNRIDLAKTSTDPKVKLFAHMFFSRNMAVGAAVSTGIISLGFSVSNARYAMQEENFNTFGAITEGQTQAVRNAVGVDIATDKLRDLPAVNGLIVRRSKIKALFQFCLGSALLFASFKCIQTTSKLGFLSLSHLRFR